MLPIIAIVGRPNVGKSTIFNRFVGRRKAIESEIAGTTRDRLMAHGIMGDFSVILVDTGGIEMDKEEGSIEYNVQEQSKLAIESADIIIFVVDIRAELTAEDYRAADFLRRSKKPVILLANKADNATLEANQYALYELGFGEPVVSSAIHSYGLDEVETKVEALLKKDLWKAQETREENYVSDKAIKISFLGRPNAGKSTFINGLLGKERVIVSDVPGTTRDTSELPFEYDSSPFVLIDTAGVRRRGKVEKGLEKYSVLRTLQAVEESDVCVLVLDAEEGVSNQDCHVSEYILEASKGLIIVMNKMDHFKGEDRETHQNYLFRVLRDKMAYVPWAPVVFTSGLERKNIFKVLDLAKQIAENQHKEIPEGDLNVWLDEVLHKHPPVGQRGKRRFAIKGVRQTGNKPPQFDFYCEWPQIMHFSYERYLENQLRDRFGFEGTAIEFKFRRA